jgi:SAM-dependent methyltransferase
MKIMKNITRVTKAATDPSLFRAALGFGINYVDRQAGECPICGYKGRFTLAINRPNAECPQCQSMERHRLIKLALDEGFISFRDLDILHFAPEPCVVRFSKPDAKSYLTGDIQPGRADRVLNIENLALEDNSLDLVICSQILEHVDDRLALAEIKRVLRPTGKALIMVPLIEGWEQTYENSSIVSEEGRDLHFGQKDHIRYYGGQDFRRRLRDAGFSFTEYTGTPEQCVRYHLIRGERLFVLQPDKGAA